MGVTLRPVWVCLAIDKDGNPTVTLWSNDVAALNQAYYLARNGYCRVTVSDREVEAWTTAADAPR